MQVVLGALVRTQAHEVPLLLGSVKISFYTRTHVSEEEKLVKVDPVEFYLVKLEPKVPVQVYFVFSRQVLVNRYLDARLESLL